MTLVAEILKSKADTAVYTVAPEATVLEALRLMADKGIGALVVADGPSILGIVTERDYARKVALMGRSSESTPVREVMTSAVKCVRPNQTGEQCMQLMTSGRLRHLPVVDEAEKLIGMVSIGDLVKDTISQQKFIIEQLEHYIHGSSR